MAYTPPISGRRSLLATGATITSTTSVAANTYYLITLAASLGNVIITLPSAPAQGTEIGFARTDASSGSTPAITAGSGDSLNETGDGTHYLIGGRMAVTFVYVGTAWYVADTGLNALGNAMAAPASAANASSLMARDSSGRSQVATPSASSDVANKSYVDSSITSANVVQYYEEVLCSAQSLTNTTMTTLTSLTSRKLIGTTAFNLSTGVWTCPADDFYTFTMTIAFTSWVASSNSALELLNSSASTAYLVTSSVINNAANAISLSGTVFVTQGTQIQFQARQDTGSSKTVDTSTNPSRCSVLRGTPTVTSAGITYNPDPIGTIKMYGGSTAPSGYLLCDGSAVSTTTYATLFAVIGYSFGGSGSTFNLPPFHDATGRFPRAQTAGTTGGSLTHNHTLSTAGQADLSFTGGSVLVKQTAVSGSFTATNQVTATSTTSSTSSANGLALSGTTDTTTTTAPYVGVTFIIKYQ
jgi:microcystin-dependent protein